MQRIEAPAITPAKGGLLAAIAPQALVEHGSFDTLAYRSEALGVAREAPEPGQDKQFDDLSLVEGEPFWVYHGAEVAVMDAALNLQVTVENALKAGQSWAVERWVRDNLFNAPTDITPTPGTAVTPRQGLGLLEQYMGDNYMGQPVVHTSRFGATALADFTDWNNGLGRTKQDTPIANGAGYRSAAAFSEFWAYATGQVNVWASQVESHMTIDPITNRRIALAERAFVITIEGPTVGVLMSSTD